MSETDLQSNAIALTCELIRRVSVTPEDAGCQQLIAERLSALGFSIEHLRFDDTDNLWARLGDSGPILCLAGHTDVVPAGPEADWSTAPFEPTLIDGTIYGRGAADMKASVAAFVVAIERLLTSRTLQRGSLAVLLTSDEEGSALNGTKKVIETLDKRGTKIDWCLLGEPSSKHQLGDTIRIGRRGSLSGILKVHGVQGHVAYPDLAENPIKMFAPVLAELYSTHYDDGNEHFPPTSFQVVSVEAGAGAPNVTPGALHARFNFRYSTQWTYQQLQEKVRGIIDRHGIEYSLDWKLSGEPFLTREQDLISATVSALEQVAKISPELSTGGGTSDGRFIAPAGAQVVELGPVNASIHKVNECVRADDIDVLVDIYQRIIESLLS